MGGLPLTGQPRPKYSRVEHILESLEGQLRAVLDALELGSRMDFSACFLLSLRPFLDAALVTMKANLKVEVLHILHFCSWGATKTKSLKTVKLRNKSVVLPICLSFHFLFLHIRYCCCADFTRDTLVFCLVNKDKKPENCKIRK